MSAVSASSFKSNALYMAAANPKESTKLLGARFGVVIDLETESKKLKVLNRRSHYTNSLAKSDGSFNLQCLTAYEPQRGTQKIMHHLVDFSSTPKDAWQFACFMHTPAGGPATHKCLETAHGSMLFNPWGHLGKLPVPISPQNECLTSGFSKSDDELGSKVTRQITTDFIPQENLVGFRLDFSRRGGSQDSEANG